MKSFEIILSQRLVSFGVASDSGAIFRSIAVWSAPARVTSELERHTRLAPKVFTFNLFFGEGIAAVCDFRFGYRFCLIDSVSIIFIAMHLCNLSGGFHRFARAIYFDELIVTCFFKAHRVQKFLKIECRRSMTTIKLCTCCRHLLQKHNSNILQIL